MAESDETASPTPPAEQAPEVSKSKNASKKSKKKAKSKAKAAQHNEHAPEGAQDVLPETPVEQAAEPGEVEWEGIPVPLLLDRFKAEIGHLAVELVVAKLRSELEHNAKGGVMNVVSQLGQRLSALEAHLLTTEPGGAFVDGVSEEQDDDDRPFEQVRSTEE